MATSFILSFDCEGKWGVADRLTHLHHEALTDARLRSAYHSILGLLDEYSVPATFAFVGLFAEPAGSFNHVMPQIAALASRAPMYLAPALSDITEGSGEGWHGAWAIEAVSAAEVGHEIALHGVTHVPWSSRERQFFVDELKLLGHLSSPVRQSKTFVFPRNKVAHVELLRSAGIRGYRTAPRHQSRTRSLLSEFNVWSKPDLFSNSLSAELVAIPAGYFVNWQRGMRRLVPRPITRARFRALLDDSADGAVVHAWLHPENVATAPGTLAVLGDILEMVARRRDAGRCVAMTQLDYVNAVTAQGR